MNTKNFEWDDNNIDHIARHGVCPDETEEVFQNRHYVLQSRSGRYLVLGRTMTGRYLVCVCEFKAHDTIRVITSMEMTDTQRKLYKRKM